VRILIIEDEHRIAQAIKKGLEQERYAVDLTFTGTDGYDMASTESYDLIILDLMLPGMDGMTVCRELRKNNIHIPILMLTAKGQIADKVTGLDAGADDYMTKPFSFEELLARVRSLTRREGAIRKTTLSAGDLTLDTKSFIVKRDNKQIALSQKEFALLEYLLIHKGEIVSKERIIEHLWDFDADILPNTIEVYIRNIRGKIDVPFHDKKPLIRTVRGFGYVVGDDKK